MAENGGERQERGLGGGQEGRGEDRGQQQNSGERGTPNKQSSAEVKTLAAGGEWCLNSPEFKIHPEFSPGALPSCYTLLNT